MLIFISVLSNMSEWTCNSHKLCQKTIPRSATVIVLVWQLCFLCISESPARPRSAFYPKNNFKMKREEKKNILPSQMSRLPVCVWLCCKKLTMLFCVSDSRCNTVNQPLSLPVTKTLTQAHRGSVILTVSRKS